MWVMSVFKHGNSYAVVVPARVRKARQWQPGTRVVWTIDGDGRLMLEGLAAAVGRNKKNAGREA